MAVITFTKYKEIKIATAGIPASDLDAFPKYFEIVADSDIAAELTSQKFCVTLPNGTTIVPYGALYCDAAAGTIKFRAKLDLKSTWTNGQTIARLWYDNGAVDQSNKSKVLNSNIKGYWPLDEDPSGSAPQMRDWTSNANHGTSAGSMTSGDLVSAKASNGLDFDGTDDRISLNNSSSSNALKPALPVTLVATFKSNSWDTFKALVSTDAFNVNYYGVYLNVSTSGIIGAQYGSGGLAGPTSRRSKAGTTVLATATWYHVAVVVRGATDMSIYVNGVDDGGSYSGTGGALVYSTAPSTIGESGGGFRFNGIIDEVTIYAADISANWIAYDYTDQFNNSATFTLGAEQSGTLTIRTQYWFNGLPFAGVNTGVASGDQKHWFNGLPYQPVFEAIASGTTYDEALADGVKSGNTFVYMLTLNPTVSDGIKSGDVAIPYGTFTRLISDGAKAGDAEIGYGTFTRLTTDGAKAGDTPSGLITFTRLTTDGAKAGDVEIGYGTFTRLTTDGIKSGDSLSTGPATYDVVMSDGVVITDINHGTCTFNRITTDGTKAGDTEAKSILLNLILVDGVKSGDSIATTVIFTRAIVDGTKAGDPIVATGTFTRLIFDGAKAGDTEAKSLIVLGLIVDGVKAGDTRIATGVFTQIVSDGTVISNTTFGTFVTTLQIHEGQTITEQIVATGGSQSNLNLNLKFKVKDQLHINFHVKDKLGVKFNISPIGV